MTPPAVEMLDQEPEPRTVPARLPWERWLGAGLLLLVLGGALFDWWHGEQQAQQYQAGQAAQAARHWDAAQAAYAALGRYRDAPVRLGDVQGQIARRDSLLQQAGGTQDAPTRWRALRAAAAIEPDYPGLAARLAAAQAAVLDVGSTGIVYLQAGGPQPGLYLTSTDGAATHLPGSDSSSQVRGVAPTLPPRFLYDSAPGDPAACRVPCAPDKRRVVLATGGATTALTTEAIGGDLAADGRAVFTSDGTGFWWVEQEQLSYFDQATGQLSTVWDRQRGGWWQALDPAGKRVLIVVPTGDTVLLYLTTAEGQQPQALSPIVAGAGLLLNAAFSPDGRYLAYETQLDDTGLIRTLWLMSLDQPQAPPLVVDSVAWQGIVAAGLTYTFVPGGARPRLLLDRRDGRTEWVLLYDMKTGERTPLWSGPGQGERSETAALSPDGRLLALHDWQDGAGTLTLVALDGHADLRTFPSPATVARQTVQSQFTPDGRSILYEVQNPEGLDRGHNAPLYVLATDAAEGTPPHLLATTSRPYAPAVSAVVLPPSGALVVYIASSGDLHARMPDGDGETRLASGVTAVWSLRNASAWRWQR